MNTVTPVSRSRHHVRRSSYHAPLRQAPSPQALPRLPALPACRRRLGQEDPRQDALLRPVGRSRRRPGEVPGTEGRPARRPQAPPRPGGRDGEGRGQRLPEREEGAAGRRRTVPAHLRRLQAGRRRAGVAHGQDADRGGPGPPGLRRPAEQDGEEVGAAPAGSDHPAHPLRLQTRFRRRPDRRRPFASGRGSSGRRRRRFGCTGRNKGRSCSPPRKSAACSTPPACR